MDANLLDIAVLAVLLFSGLFAMMRGFVQETLSIAGWIGAGLVALYGLPQARPIAAKYISSPTMADVAAGAALFLGTLVILSIITHFIAKQVRGSMLGHLDRSLGFGFGLARGALIACLAYMLALFIYTPEQGSAKEASGAKLPGWITEAKARPYLERGAIAISALLPEAYDMADRAKQVREDANTVMKANEIYNKMLAPKPRGEQQSGQPQNTAPTYSSSDRDAMNKLVQPK
jgi:membrane protein required for colicin V production